MPHYTYYTTDEDPSIAFRLLDRTGTVVDLSGASAWAMYLVDQSTGALDTTVSTGFTGYATLQGTAPHQYNALLQWSSGALASIGAGRYAVDGLQVTISSRQRSFLLPELVTIEVRAVPT